MKRKLGKRVASVIMMLALAVTFMPVSNAWAAQVAAKVVTKDKVETTYTTVSDAIAAMTDGATLYLQEDSKEEIDVPYGQHWTLSAGDYTYSGYILTGTGATIELLDGSYSKGFFLQELVHSDDSIIIHDGVKAVDDSARTIMERHTKPEQWCREYGDEQYVVETTDYLPYKVNGKLYASSARATYDILDGDTLYIVKDTDRGLASDNASKSYDIDAGNCKVSGDILHFPKN